MGAREGVGRDREEFPRLFNPTLTTDYVDADTAALTIKLSLKPIVNFPFV